MKGNQPFRDALAAHMTRKFGGYNFASEHFIVLAGCGAVIDMLAYCFCDDGECIMLPTPYYPCVCLVVNVPTLDSDPH